MNKIIGFLDNYYEKAIRLSNDFDKTRNFEWTPLLILNELSVQVGHIYNIIYQSESVNETNRTFTNLGDELSDVFLQLIALADSMNIDMYRIKDIKPMKEDNWLAFPVLFGQLNEAVMEKYGFRFNKPRCGFRSTDEFIENRIFRLFDITFQIAEKYKLDIEKEFSLMLDDANAFLKRFKGHKTEYIDTYNDNHIFISRFNKNKAHQLGLWHDVVGSLIVNPISKTVFFQLKNHLHNGINDRDLLEITAGGHLQSGESLQDVTREVKEETGLEVDFNNFVNAGMRKCDTDNNMVIREFQHYYLLFLDISVQEFTPEDDEVKGFVEIDLHKAIDIISNGGTGIASINVNGTIKQVEISRSDFDGAFVNNGVFLNLLKQAEEYTKGQRGLKNEIK